MRCGGYLAALPCVVAEIWLRSHTSCPTRAVDLRSTLRRAEHVSPGFDDGCRSARRREWLGMAAAVDPGVGGAKVRVQRHPPALEIERSAVRALDTGQHLRRDAG